MRWILLIFIYQYEQEPIIYEAASFTSNEACVDAAEQVRGQLSEPVRDGWGFRVYEAQAICSPGTVPE